MAGDPYLVRKADCPSGPTCPQIHHDPSRGTFRVTGAVVAPEDAAAAGAGPGETAVDIPASLLPELLPAGPAEGERAWPGVRTP